MNGEKGGEMAASGKIKRTGLGIWFLKTLHRPARSPYNLNSRFAHGSRRQIDGTDFPEKKEGVEKRKAHKKRGARVLWFGVLPFFCCTAKRTYVRGFWGVLAGREKRQKWNLVGIGESSSSSSSSSALLKNCESACKNLDLRKEEGLFPLFPPSSVVWLEEGPSSFFCRAPQSQTDLAVGNSTKSDYK